MSDTLTSQHAVSQLATFGIDVEIDRCDPAALRADADDIREGVKPLHLDSLPPRFAADLLDTLADIIDPQPCHADNAPSIDQIEAAHAILREREHPLLTGCVVTGHRATYSTETRVYSLAVDIIEAPDEIYASPATRCYRILPDGSLELIATAR